MTTKKEASSTGVSGMFLLFLVFLTLKLTGYIDWSWWWVTAPLWGGIALFIVIGLLVLLFAFILAVIDR